MVKIAIVGVGTVGCSVVKIIEKNSSLLNARAGKELKVVRGVVRDLTKKRDIDIPLTDNVNEVLNDKTVNQF